jgi:hypothetical protein
VVTDEHANDQPRGPAARAGLDREAAARLGLRRAQTVATIWDELPRLRDLGDRSLLNVVGTRIVRSCGRIWSKARTMASLSTNRSCALRDEIRRLRGGDVDGVVLARDRADSLIEALERSTPGAEWRAPLTRRAGSHTR